MEDECGAPVPWIFEATVSDPTRLRVHVAVTVPPSASWEDVGECSEIAQMTASRAIAHARQNRKNCQERCPF